MEVHMRLKSWRTICSYIDVAIITCAVDYILYFCQLPKKKKSSHLKEFIMVILHLCTTFLAEINITKCNVLL